MGPLIDKMTNGVISMQRTVNMGAARIPQGFAGFLPWELMSQMGGYACFHRWILKGAGMDIVSCCGLSGFEYEMVHGTYIATYIYRRRVFP